MLGPLDPSLSADADYAATAWSLRPATCCLAGLFLASFFLMESACTIPPKTTKSGVLVESQPIASANPRATESRQFQPIASAAPATLPASESGSIHCGNAACDAATEICCGFGDKQTCLLRSVMPSPDVQLNYGWLGKVATKCAEAMDVPVNSPSVFLAAFCDDSSDCPGGSVCCASSGHMDITSCEPADPGGSFVCGFAEVCNDGTCATPGTHCVKHDTQHFPYPSWCRLDDARVNCNGVVCGGSTPICCSHRNGPPSCEHACEERRQIQCSGAESCPKGALCSSSNLESSRCRGDVDTASETVLCESDDECPARHPWCAVSVCNPADNGFKTCECP